MTADIPLTCDFCAGPDKVHWAYPVGAFETIAGGATVLVPATLWSACDPCKSLIDADKLGDLVDRACRMYALRVGHPLAPDVLRDMKQSIRRAHSKILRNRHEAIPESQIPPERRSNPSNPKPLAHEYVMDAATGVVRVFDHYSSGPHPLRTEIKGDPE